MLEGYDVSREAALNDLEGSHLQLLNHDAICHWTLVVRFLRGLPRWWSNHTASNVSLVWPKNLQLRLLTVLSVNERSLLAEQLSISEYNGGCILNSLTFLGIYDVVLGRSSHILALPPLIVCRGTAGSSCCGDVGASQRTQMVEVTWVLVLQSDVILGACLRVFSFGVCLKKASIDVPRVSRTGCKATCYDNWRLELLGSKVRIENVRPLAPIRDHLNSICGTFFVLFSYCVLEAWGSRAIDLIIPSRPSSLAETLRGW